MALPQDGLTFSQTIPQKSINFCAEDILNAHGAPSTFHHSRAELPLILPQPNMDDFSQTDLDQTIWKSELAKAELDDIYFTLSLFLPTILNTH